MIPVIASAHSIFLHGDPFCGVRLLILRNLCQRHQNDNLIEEPSAFDKMAVAAHDYGIDCLLDLRISSSDES